MDDVKPIEADYPPLDNTFYQSSRLLAVSRLDFPLGVSKLIPFYDHSLNDPSSIGAYFVTVEWRVASDE